MYMYVKNFKISLNKRNMSQILGTLAQSLRIYHTENYFLR